MKLEHVVEGINRYLNAELLNKLNDWQEIFARVIIGRFLENTDAIKEMLVSNGIFRSLGFIDAEGNIDIDAVLSSLKKEIERKERLTISLPLIGDLTFTSGDVDLLHRHIEEGHTSENSTRLY